MLDAGHSFKEANLEGANFRKIESFQLDFAGANLVDVQAFGGKFPRAVFTDANIQNLEVGTPLQHEYMWDFAQVQPNQLAEIRGIANIHHLIGSLMYFHLQDHPKAPFVSGMVSSGNFGCWDDGYSRIALHYPDFFELWIKTWRENEIDQMTRDWMELELACLLQRLQHKPEAEFWRNVRSYPLPRVWSIYFKWKEKWTEPGESGLGSVVEREELEGLGGCREDCWSWNRETPRRLEGPPSFLTRSDVSKVRETLEAVSPMTSAELAQCIIQHYSTTFLSLHSNTKELPEKRDALVETVAAG